MAELAQESCEVCRVGAPGVSEEEVARLKPQIPEWELIDDGGIRKLRRTFSFPNFAQALDFTVRVGELAESEGHHPEIVTGWGKATVVWWTHKIRDLHRNDFIMAAKTDGLYGNG